MPGLLLIGDGTPRHEISDNSKELLWTERLQVGVADILIVEDSPTMRQLVAFALRRLVDVHVVEATDGVEAVRLLAERHFDLIVADINMPVMDGLKLLHHVKTDPRKKGIPVVIITTEGAQEDRERAMDLGAAAYLIKPIETQELVQTISRFLEL